MTFVSQHRYKILLFILALIVSGGALFLDGYLRSTAQSDPWLRSISKASRYQQKNPDLRFFSVRGRSFFLGSYPDPSGYEFSFIDPQGRLWCRDRVNRLADLLSQLYNCGSRSSSDRLSETALQDLANGIHPHDAIKLTEERVRETQQSIDGLLKYRPSGSIGTNEYSLLDEELEGSPLVWTVSWSFVIEDPKTKQIDSLSLYFDIDAQNGTIIRERIRDTSSSKNPPSN